MFLGPIKLPNNEIEDSTLRKQRCGHVENARIPRVELNLLGAVLRRVPGGSFGGSEQVLEGWWIPQGDLVKKKHISTPKLGAETPALEHYI